jgi:ATP-dependent DNA ligase
MDLPVLYKRTVGGKLQTWQVSVEDNGNGTSDVVIVQGLLGGKKQTYRETIEEGKNLKRSNATTAHTQAIFEARSKWNKQKDRKHYGEDAEGEESAAKRAEAPMLAYVYEDHYKKVDWEYAYAQPKLDGNRCLAKMDGDGKVTLWTRKGVEIKTLGHLIDPLRAAMNPSDTLDGEAYVHGLHVTNLRSLLTRPQEGCEKVSFRIYDQLSPLPYCKRWQFLMERDLKIGEPKHGLCLVPTIRVMNEKELMKFQRDCIEEEGFEGAMLRWGEFGYEAGVRSQGLLKVKTFDDAEFPIVDVTDGTGTFKGVAVLVCRTPAGHEFTVTAPGTIEDKKRIFRHSEEVIGKKVTVKFAGYTKTEEPVPFQPVAKCILD